MSRRSLLASVTFAVLFAACSASQASSQLGGTCDTFRASPAVAQTAEIPAGSDVRIALCSNPSTGFSWDQPTIADPSVLQVVDRAYEAPAVGSAPVVGAAGGEVLVLRGLKAGSTTLSMSYGQPWAGGTKGEWTYTLSVTVR